MMTEVEMDGREPLGMSWIGILLAVFGNIVLAIGFVIQKHAHLRHQEGSKGTAAETVSAPSQTSESSDTSGAQPQTLGMPASGAAASRLARDLYFVKYRSWALGLALIAAGEVCNGLALAFTSGSRVPAIGALALVVIALLSFACLGERPSALNWAGLVVATVGVALVGVFAPMSNTSEAALTPAEAQFLVSRAPATAVLSAYGAALLAMCVASAAWPAFARSHVLVFCALAAVNGAFKQRSLKIVLQLLSEQVMQRMTGALSIWRSALFWTSLVLAVLSTVAGMYFLNKALGAFPRTALPVFFCLFVLLSSVSSNVVYREWTDDMLNIAGYVSGLASVTVGCVLYCAQLPVGEQAGAGAHRG
jgi:drug/metabolite transporter (DMT)-like permease